jgi:TIR domain
VRRVASRPVKAGSTTKQLQLYVGDLSSIPPEEAVDVLVVSAFPDDYAPTPTSLIGALAQRGISVLELSRHKEADLRAAFSSWLSRDVSALSPHAGFGRILCFESGLRGPPTETVGDVFRAIVPFAMSEPPIRSIAMPILASGDQGFDIDVMFTAICDAATHWLAAGLPIDTVKVVARTVEAAERLAVLLHPLDGDDSARPRSVGALSAGGAEQHDFFLSYAHADSADADELVQELKQAAPSARVFQDKLVLNAGQSWQLELDRALESSKHVIALYSPSYLQSKMCIEEFNMARIRHRESDQGVLKPIYLRTAELPLYMRSVQYLDCREANRRLFAKAVRQLIQTMTH